MAYWLPLNCDRAAYHPGIMKGILVITALYLALHDTEQAWGMNVGVRESHNRSRYPAQSTSRDAASQVTRVADDV
ncbi:MAG: hypothetical protein RIS36_1045 [Pseudomonadota bacterium]|jgi:hypothetical protein